MKKRLLAALLAFCMTVSLFPMQAMAAAAGNTSALGSLGIRQISSTAYSISPDVREYEWVLNNGALTQQMMGHVMEVKVGGGSTASIAVGYGDDNIEAIASGRNWTMMETTHQAGAMQNRRGTNVVGAINAGGYDMSSGRPSGAFTMNGTQINAATGTTFWIDKSGSAHITNAQECNAAYAAGNVREAIASFGEIFEDGHARPGLDNSTRASRTAIGIKADGSVVMFMVDGRQAPYSVGMTMAEVAAAMEELGCVQAINLDGGGSSTFATQREGEKETTATAGLALRCRPSDGYERKVSNTIMVLSTAKATGEFDHAILSPNDEVYTPGSQVQLTAAGADSAGGPANVPAGAQWTVVSGGGSIDQNGLYTAGGAEGEVTVALVLDGKTVGQTTLQLRWPDKLGFTNNSVSIDFGETSNLTFKPTWKGREVKYKDGDFEWSLDESKPISYKYNALVETRGWSNGWKDRNIYMSLTGAIGVQQKLEWGLYETRTYYSYFTEASRTIDIKDGSIQVTETLTHDKAEKLNGDAAGKCSDEELAERVNLTHEFSLGCFAGNSFTADSDNSLRATAKVSLKNNATVTGEIDLIVGLEPLVLMDFEDGDGQNWDTIVTSRSNGTGGQLTAEQVAQYGMWVRTATGAGVDFDGSGVVSAAEDDRVRFGENAFKLCFDFTPMGNNTGGQAAADAGFACDLYVNTVQPTKIGMWVNVPAELKDCPYLLKAIVAGGVTSENGNASLAGYNRLNADGTKTFVPGNTMPRGTTMYTQYYGKDYDDKGNEITLTTLGEMAGKGWIWVEADISSIQMPIDIYRAYTFRVVKTATVSQLAVGHILVDNVQFIYGTNTNDVTRPVLESVTETSSGAVLAGDGSTVLESGNLTFAAVYSDNELTDKYATGIDQSGIRVLLDGVDHTSEVEINDGSLYLKGMALRNGTHTLTIRLKDFYGNVTTENRVFRVEDPVGTEAGIAVLPQPGAPEIGRDFTLWIVNQTGEDVTQADLTIDIPAKYLEGAEAKSFSDDYEVILDTAALAKGQAKIKIQKIVVVQSLAAADYDYDYASELGYLIIRIPEDAANDDSFAYTVSRGEYTTMDKDGVTNKNSFSGTEQRIALSADYQLTCSQAVAGLATTITVTDKSGQPVAMANVKRKTADGEALLGRTNLKGQVTYTFSDAGEQTLHAEVNGKGRSWDLRLVVCQQTPLAEGEKVFGILTNGTQAPETSQSISWISAIGTSAAAAKVKYSEKADPSGEVTAEGTSRIVTFVQSTSGDALRVNQVTLSGLAAGKTYYFQVGDGTADGWSEIRTFRTADASAESTDFFILGDIQSSGDTSKLSSVLDKLKASPFDFAIQTGDAIDNVTAFQSNWWPFLNTMNAGSLGGTDLIHALGNHEYYGDAEGSISGAVYDLPQSAQNGWYTMDYGKVSVTVINHGTDMASALREIAETMDTDCIWKVLVSHEPIYGTNPDSGEPSAEILSLIEKAGFDFVFGGDDHAYARTKPMLSGSETDDVRRGVVYYVCGDLSAKTNNFAKRDCYAVAVPHVDYEGLYLTAQATDERITVIAYDWKGVEIDRYTKERTDCELGRHTVDSTSLYRMSDHTLQCTLCGSFAPVPASASGLYSTTDGGTVILAEGKAKTNEFTQMGDVMYHSCQSGYAFAAAGKNNGSCTTSGTVTYTCPSCSAVKSTGPFMPEGHKWDADHVCTVCGFHGIDINSAEVDIQLGTPDKPIGTDAKGYRYNHKPSGTIPYFYAQHNGKTLGCSQGDRLENGKIVDLFLEYQNNKQVGKATVRLSGRGDYYGTKELYYYIYPTVPTDLRAAKTMDTYVKLNWAVSSGAEHYLIYQCNANNSSRTLVADVGKTSGYTVTGLEMETNYYFVIYGYTDVNGERYQSRASNILAVTTNGLSADVTGVSASVNGQTICLSEGGKNTLFLPGSADLSALSLHFDFDGNQGALTLSGDLGSLTLDSTDAVADITGLSSRSGGKYTLTARVGGGDPFTFSVMQGSEIPALYLTSTEEGHDRDYVDASKDNKVQASLLMTDESGTALYDGTLKQLKARGNSTFLYAPKKSYQIKLDTPSDLLDTGEQVKTWVLLAGYFDATQMHDKLVKDLAAQFGLAYTPNCGWVELYYDGEYRGLYLLSEKNSIDKTSVDILDLEKIYEDLNRDYGTDMDIREEPTAAGGTIRYTANIQDPWRAMDGSGYLLEMNYHNMEEDSSFKTSRGYAFNVKSPEWCGKEAMTYISSFYQDFEDAVYSENGYNAATGKYYYDYVDLDSLVKTFLLQELAYNCDGFRYSQYFYLDGGKLYAGPVWDQEMTFGTGWSGYLPADRVSRFDLGAALANIPGFMDAVQTYYEETFRPMIGELDSTVRNQYALLKDSAAMNYTLWPLVRVGDPNNANHLWKNADYASVIADLRDWIDLRLETLDELYLPQPEVLLGDVDSDGEVTVTDARWLLQYLAGIRDLTNDQIAAADVDGDGEATVTDARWLLQYLAGMRNGRFELID